MPLFRGRDVLQGVDSSISIGPVGDPTSLLSIGVEWYDRGPNPGSDDVILRAIDRIGEFHPGGKLGLVFRAGGRRLVIPISTRSEFVRNISLFQIYLERDGFRNRNLQTVPPEGLNRRRIETLWDQASLTRQEEEVIEAMRLLAPEIERLSMRRIDTDSDDRFPFVKIRHRVEPMTLRCLGDGVNRLFGLALALVNSKGGVCVADEIENGIHYAALTDIWRFILRMAASIDVQVFATTHSSDCVRAFQEAASESEEEGVLIRLGRKGDRTIVAEFDEETLAIAVDGDIEVR